MWESLSIGCCPHKQKEGDRQRKETKRGNCRMCSGRAGGIPGRCATNILICLYQKSEDNSVRMATYHMYYLGQAFDQHGT